MKTLHLIDSFDYNGSARQIRLLAPALAKHAISVEVCCLGPETPWLANLRQAGVIVHALGWTRWFDPSVVWNLRAVLREALPDVIHVWRLPALRTLGIVAGALLPRVVMSDLLAANARLTWWDRRLLAQVRCVAAAGDADRARCLHHGVAEARMRTVAPLTNEKRCQDPLLKKGPDTLKVACVGRLERAYGFRNAIWAFDFLRHRYPSAQLDIVGAGSQRAALEALTIGLQGAGRMNLLGPRADASAVLQGADIVVVPSLASCGRQTTLEALALGRPVVASDLPCLRELIDDGVTGMLVQPGDVIQLARRTHMLLGDEALREQLGAAASASIQARFPFDAALESWRRLYRDAAA